ncbi:MAG: hypothetical protein Q7J60_16175, partial [Bradyrhizobium sp.]|nr:hypothetical protein [Bradyrhizobium sp.]
LHGVVFEILVFGSVGNRSACRRKAAPAAFTTRHDPSCLPRLTGAKLAPHIKGRVLNAAGDRRRRFYRIERRGRVE